MDILTKKEPIKSIFLRLIEQEPELQEKISNSKCKEVIYEEILKDKVILERIPQIELIKQLYYQIIDLRLFASQNINRETEKTVAQVMKELQEVIKQEFESRNIIKLDEESLELINAELFSRFFNEDNYFKVNEVKSAKQMKLALYYSIAEQIESYIKSDEKRKIELTEIQRALKQSKITFADILERLNWFNSELVRNQNSPFSFNTAVFKPKMENVIEEMHKVGAIVEVAHPFIYGVDNLSEYLEMCIGKGVDGIEAFYCLPNTDEEEYDRQKRFIQKFCQKRSLICNHGGSDYHKEGIDKIGILRSGERINEDELASEINTISAKEFMEQMEKTIEKEENSR